MSVERRPLPATDLEVSVLGIDLCGPLPPSSEGVLYRALRDGVNLVRLPLGDPGRAARRLLQGAYAGPAECLVVVGVPPQGPALAAPGFAAAAEPMLPFPHQLMIELDGSGRGPGDPIPSPASGPESRTLPPRVGRRVDPPYDGRARAHRTAFVSVRHSLWEPGIVVPPGRVPERGSAGILVLDPWPGIGGIGAPFPGSDGSGPGGPVPIARLREAARRMIEFADLVRLGGRALPEIALRYALDTPGVSAALLPLPSPELWAMASRAAGAEALTDREQAWIRQHAESPRPAPGSPWATKQG